MPLESLLAGLVSTNVAWWFMLSLAPMVGVMGVVMVVYDRFTRRRNPEQ